MAAKPVATFPKDPAAVLVYGLDLSRWLPDGVTVTGVTWTLTGPAGDPGDTALALDTSLAGFESGGYVDPTGTAVALALKLGTEGATYRADALYTLSDGQKDSRSLGFKVLDR